MCDLATERSHEYGWNRPSKLLHATRDALVLHHAVVGLDRTKAFITAT